MLLVFKKVRGSLLCFESAAAQESDEILFMFAEQLVSLVDLVGGAEHAGVLIQPLQSLLGVDETFVRNAVSRFEVVFICHCIVPQSC